MDTKSDQLTLHELERYSRQLNLPGLGIEQQKVLKKARVLIVGVGGLGCPLSLYLAAAGVGRLGLVEPDRVSLSNLHRQILYNTEDVGKMKLEVAQEKLRLCNPNVEVSLYPYFLTADNIVKVSANYSIIVDATDNLATRYILNDYCIITKKTLVYGSISGFEGCVSTVQPELGPCYRCLFPTLPPREALPTCNEGGVLGVISGTIALIQATEVIKVILNIGNSLAGRIMLFNGLGSLFKEINLLKDPECGVCGSHPSINSLDELVKFHENTNIDTSIELDADELESGLKQAGKIFLIDVREFSETLISRIGASILIPLGKLPERVAEIPRNEKIVLYCQSGVRSLVALKFLKSAGFKQVQHLKGGIDAYKMLDKV